MVMAMVFLSFTLVARFAMRIERAANRMIRMMFWAMPERVVSGLRMKVMPSTMRKIAMIRRFRIMISILFVMLSAFLIVLSKFGFFDIILFILYHGMEKLTNKHIYDIIVLGVYLFSRKA